MPAEVVPINPKPATKPPSLPDLIGREVEVHFIHALPGAKPQIGKLERVTTRWLLVSWVYRRRKHWAYMPTAGIQMVKWIERLPQRPRSASYR